MKKFLFIAAICAAFIACNSNDPEGPKQSVTFKVKGFEQSTEPMNSPRRAPQSTILDDEGGTALTDLYVFDGTTQLVHQVYADDNDAFGTVTLELTHGQHNLSFVATRSEGQSYSAGILSVTSLRPTFGKVVTLNVTNNTPNQDLQLNRLNGQLYLTINDEFPVTANQIEFIATTRYTSLDVVNLIGINGAEWSQKVSCASKQGQSGVVYNFAMLAPSSTEEYITDLTINVYDVGGSVISSVTVEDVRIAANTKTMLSGSLFSAQGASITVNTTWNQSIVGSF